MHNRALFLSLFVVSVILSIWIKMNRPEYFGLSPWSDILLGSLPSFLLVSVLGSGYVVFTNNLSRKKFTQAVFAVSAGALVWEIETFSAYENLIFDWNDVVAIVLAAIVLLLMNNARNEAAVKKP